MSKKGVSTKTGGRDSDPLRLEIEQVLRFGTFIRYDGMFAFTHELDAVEEKLEALATGDEAERAMALYEVFLAGCYEKIEECDDSSGSLGMFWDTLFRGWVVARQASGCPAAETIQLIMNWKAADQYGFCYDIEKEVAPVLNDEEYSLLVAHLQKCVGDALAAIQPPRPAAIYEYDSAVRLPVQSLKEVFRVRGDAASYAAMCERLGMNPMDCQRLAEMEKAKRHWKQALEWVDKGLALEGEKHWHNESARSLDDMRIELLGRLGRKDEAVAQAWTAFEKYPDVFLYEALMRHVPKNSRNEWQERALKTAETADFGNFLELCAKTKEWDRLATRVLAATQEALETVSHYPAEQAAKGLARPHPMAAAALHRAMGFRVLTSGKSKYYGAALANFKHARTLFLKAGLASEWDATIARVHYEHGRKRGFLADFERLAAGASIAEPTFDSRIRNRLKTIMEQ